MEEYPVHLQAWTGATYWDSDNNACISLMHRCKRHPVNTDNLPDQVRFKGMKSNVEGFFHLEF